MMELIRQLEQQLAVARLSESLKPAEFAHLDFTDSGGLSPRRVVKIGFASDTQARAFLDALKAATGKS